MPVVNVNIQPAIISWALSQSDEVKLGDKLMKNIREWLDGSKIPTFNQIEDFSRKSNIPIGYFFLQNPPVEEVKLLEFRTIDSTELANPSRDIIDTIREMESIQDWMKQYREDTGFEELSIVGCLKNQTDVNRIVEKIRYDLDLPLDWNSNCRNMSEAFAYTRDLLEKCGVLVMLNGVVGKNTHRSLSIDEFRAFALVDEWAPLIFINSADSQGGKLFSLYHELVHIWLGIDDLYNDRKHNSSVKPLEVLCNAVACELIVPENMFLEIWSKCNDFEIDEKIAYIAKNFKCSDSVIARKALDHKLIDQMQYMQIVNDAIDAYREMKERKETNGGNYYNTMGTRLDSVFVRAMCESIQMGRTSYTEAYRLTNTSRKTFPKIAESKGGVV